MSNRRKIGILGEKLSQDYLREKGYIIKECNYRKKCGEIDIIATDKKGILTFFEIKTRTNNKFGTPSEAVTTTKQLKILKTVDFYLKENPVFLNCEYHIDVISVYLNYRTRLASLIHLKNAIFELDFED